MFAYIAPTYKQAKAIVWRDPRMLRQYLPREVLKKDFNESELYAELWNDSVIQIRGADDPDSIRGSDFFGVILDEFALMKREIWEEILRPVLTENGGWAWFLFTPKGRNHAHQYWTSVPSWGKDWARFFLSAKDSGLISAEDLAQAKREMPEALFRQEFLCEFLEGEGAVFKGIGKCIAGELEEVQPGGRYIIGIDLARVEDFTALVCMDVFEKRVVAFERFNQCSWGYQKEKISQMALRYNDALVVIEANSIGDPISEDLSNNGVNIERFITTERSKRDLIDKLILAIEQRLILFPNIPELIAELEAFSYEIIPSGFRYSAPDGMHDDCVMALALATKGLQGFLYNKKTDWKNLPREAVYSE